MQRPSKIFVTGANGFIGRSLMRRFREQGVAVCGVDLVADQAWNVIAGNVASAGSWQSQAKGCELVIHTAAVVSNSAPAELYRNVSVGSVRHVINAAIKAEAHRVVHLSSIAAYGLNFSHDRVETDAISLLSGYPYCDAKAASEHAALAAHAAGEMACTIIRPGDVYGPGSRPWVLIPLSMMRKNQFFLPALGRGIFSPVYIDNLLDGIEAAALSPAAGAGQIYNITDGTQPTCREFFAHHWQWLGRKGTPPMLPNMLASPVVAMGAWLLNDVLKQNSEISVGSLAMLKRQAGYSIVKAQHQLGYQPKINLSQGMELTESWLKAEKQI
ncbi:MAG: NAD(P)-dependent oxidoreductase [Pseudomonadales bacterium]|nr:NAD(P)-dependent oxidoreductase [Pseudomonadales bacterium]